MLYDSHSLLVLALGLLRIQAASAGRIYGRATQGERSLKTFYEEPHGLSFEDRYGGQYSVELDAETLYGPETISDWHSASSGIDNGDGATTFRQLLQDVDSNVASFLYNLVLTALGRAHESASERWSACNTGPWDLPTSSDPSSATNQGDWINSGNKGAGTTITAGLSVIAIFLSDKEAKMATLAIAAGFRLHCKTR
ncbi:MAG: hypothetical protein Q9170_004483 [Blastenia crenularia]